MRKNRRRRILSLRATQELRENHIITLIRGVRVKGHYINQNPRSMLWRRCGRSRDLGRWSRTIIGRTTMTSNIKTTRRRNKLIMHSTSKRSGEPTMVLIEEESRISPRWQSRLRGFQTWILYKCLGRTWGIFKDNGEAIGWDGTTW